MKKTLIHLITNYVTVNDVVNIILSCGGSAICADAPEEVEEITGIADSLVPNPGLKLCLKQAEWQIKGISL